MKMQTNRCRQETNHLLRDVHRQTDIQMLGVALSPKSLRRADHLMMNVGVTVKVGVAEGVDVMTKMVKMDRNNIAKVHKTGKAVVEKSTSF